MSWKNIKIVLLKIVCNSSRFSSFSQTIDHILYAIDKVRICRLWSERWENLDLIHFLFFIKLSCQNSVCFLSHPVPVPLTYIGHSHWTWIYGHSADQVSTRPTNYYVRCLKLTSISFFIYHICVYLVLH